MTFNVHQLLHAGDCVSHWGPLWGYSAYGFEDLYGKLMKMFNGTQKVGDQIVKRFHQLQTLKALTAHLVDPNDQKFEKIQRKLLGNFTPVKNMLQLDGVFFYWSRYTLKKICPKSKRKCSSTSTKTFLFSFFNFR